MLYLPPPLSPILEPFLPNLELNSGNKPGFQTSSKKKSHSPMKSLPLKYSPLKPSWPSGKMKPSPPTPCLLKTPLSLPVVPDGPS
jgi:hypothetical protein